MVSQTQGNLVSRTHQFPLRYRPSNRANDDDDERLRTFEVSDRRMRKIATSKVQSSSVTPFSSVTQFGEKKKKKTRKEKKKKAKKEEEEGGGGEKELPPQLSAHPLFRSALP